MASQENQHPKDPRNIADLHRAFENVDYYVRKKYRTELSCYPICDLPQWLADGLSNSGEGANALGSNVQFAKVEKIVYDKSESITDKLTTVYHTLSSFDNTSVILLLLSDSAEVELYLGVAERFQQGMPINFDLRGNKSNTLETAFAANFPGSILKNKIKKNGKVKPIKTSTLIERAFSNVSAVSCVTGIASSRNKEHRENDQFIQGMEKLIDAMRGKKYSAVFIADCKSALDIEEICGNYEAIYSSLYPFLQSQQTVGTTEGVTDTESFIKGVTDTTNESISNSLSKSHTVGKSSSHSVGGSVSVGGSSGFFPGPNASVSASYNRTWGKNESDTDTHTDTKTTGTSKSLSEQNSVAKSIATSTNDGLQITYQNRTVKTLLDTIDEQIKHLRSCEAFGVFDFSCYFLAEESAISKSAASVYDSLMRGEESGTEISGVSTWYNEEAQKSVEYLKRFYHPLVAVPDLSIKPDEDGRVSFMAVTPSTIISGKEIALHMALPKKSVPGIPVSKCADFGRNIMSLDGRSADSGIALGKVYHMQSPESTPVYLDADSLSMHTFITGSTGSGKSNTVYKLIDQLRDHHAKFLIIEPAKGEYKNVFGNRGDVNVYGTNPQLTDLLRINPFSFPKEIHIYEHMDRLVEIFNVCWPMYAAMPAILKDAIERAYIAAGWDLQNSTNAVNDRLFPNFVDVLREIEDVMNESQYSSDSKGDYKGALCTRLKSLTNGINGLLFTANELSAEDLFDKNVIVDLSRVGSTETKSLIMGLLVMKLQEYRMSTGTMNSHLHHVTVLEEAHNLLKRTSTEQSADSSNMLGKSVEMLTNAIAEMRTYGEGFIIADQAPGLLDMAVIRNTNTKIILRLPEYSDRELVGKAIGLNDDQIEELAKLKKGVAAVYQNDWLESVLCQVEKFEHDGSLVYRKVSANADASKIKRTELFHALLRTTLPEEPEWFEEKVLFSELPARVKYIIHSMLKNGKHRDFASISSVMYALIDGKTIFSKIDSIKTPDTLRSLVKKHISLDYGNVAERQLDLLIKLLRDAHIGQYPEQTEQIDRICRVVK